MIKLLDQTTIDKIAAGEVIERPSSVVKELLENSIDAGATAITVEIKEGGLSFIRVTDNGCGIPKEQVQTAYLRHATSKIETVEDLSYITSLGFRGEALSTIAAVSQCEMVTKTAGSITGVKYVINGGVEEELKEIGVPEGTTIVVRNLFYNTPARKKFLKSSMTEASYIADLVLRIALSHPDIALKLIVNGQAKISSSGNGDLKNTIYELFGRDITSNIMEVSCEDGDIKISGYIGKPFIARGNRGLETYFINRRFIRSNVVNRAIEEGYKTFVMQHKFPFTVLYIDLPTEKCDINVHPTKMEFKYDNEKQLFETITHTIKDALNGKEIIPKEVSYGEKEEPAAEKTKPAEPYEVNRKEHHTPKPDIRAGKYSPTYKILESLKKNEEQQSKNEEPQTPNYAEQIENTVMRDKGVQYTAQADRQTSMFDDDFLTQKARPKHRIIGQVFGTYWLMEYEKNLYIMDQHAAHEKVKYEELMSTLKGREVLSQQLMPPMVITVSYAERQAILDHYDLFMKIGYDIVEFGGNEFKINAVPSNIYGIHGRQMFMEFVGSLINNSGYVTDDVFIKRLSTMACKAAIKGNTQITLAEANALIEKLLTLENPYTCPHGRPTIISISEQELEKKFKRIV
ncbi:MAG: DNA mismatch repair endonuclease MutL [Clostridium sp.]|nr:DNA mismatch repair endonuclease MutL [Clostridium sp.]MCM1398804.1 DNA mismatch repair endonuclease MutL [Clostridium sp.]MCM1458564.1 DNA mismatch repair endonuclease MutL [Bacteroides sp.]